MNIKRENYEIWAIDYLEGKLSTSEIALLMAFLADNPDLADELDNIRDNQIIPDSKVASTNFNFLKKKFGDISLDSHCFEEFCIAYHEGDLNNEDQEKLMEYIGLDTSKQKLFETYKNLRVQPNESIVFQNKAALKKTAIIPTVWTRKRIIQLSSSIAAAALVLFALNYSYIGMFDSTNTLTNTAQLSNKLVKQDSIQSIHVNPEIISMVNKYTTTINVPVEDDKPILISQRLIKEVVDTSEWLDIFIPISRIEINSIPTNNNEPAIVFNRSNYSSYYRQTKKTLPERTIKSIQQNGQLLIAKAGKLTLDNMLRKGVDGINQVVETDLQYNSEIDDDGRIIAFALSSERFNIKRKLRSN